MIGGKKHPEQGEIRVLEFRGGTAGNIVPLHCRLVLEGEHELADDSVTVSIRDGNTVIEAEGVSAHGSRPELGENAVARKSERKQMGKHWESVSGMRKPVRQLSISV